MSRIGILTYHDSDNYGSVLQAYALSTYINSGISTCEIIDYRKKEVGKLYKIFKPWNSKYNIIMNFYSFINYANLKNKKKKFENFRKNHLSLSKERFEEMEELKKTNYEKYIVGSDQIWNNNIIDFDTSYLLDFTNKEKYSYGASLGPLNKGNNEFFSIYKNLLNKFRKVTFREKQNSMYFNQTFDKKSDVVCDPVFLLDKTEWQKVESDSNFLEKKYILCYFAGGRSKAIDEYSKKLAKLNNCKRILIMPNWKDIFANGKKMYNVGPSEFLTLIKNAEYVCTNSFHGTAFSIIYDKKVIVDDSYNDARIRNIIELSGRFDSLLSNEDRMINNSDSRELDELIYKSKEYVKKISSNNL